MIAQCKKRHRHQDFLAFLRLIDKEVPTDLDILVVDNYATHEHQRLRLGLPSSPATTYTTYASWLNQVGRWFGLITQRAIKRDSFRNIKHLVKTIEEFTHRHNEDANRSYGPLRPNPSWIN